MGNLEANNNQESMKDLEMNEAIESFSDLESQAKNEVVNTINAPEALKAQSKENLEKDLKSGELKKRIEEYIQVNGKKIENSEISIDAKGNILL